MEPFESTTNYLKLSLMILKLSLTESELVFSVYVCMSHNKKGQFPFLLTWKWENIVSTKLCFIKASTEKGGG